MIVRSCPRPVIAPWKAFTSSGPVWNVPASKRMSQKRRGSVQRERAAWSTVVSSPAPPGLISFTVAALTGAEPSRTISGRPH